VTRVQVILEEEERERLRRQAEREGISLSAWMRRAATEKLTALEGRVRIQTEAELRVFFAACDSRETGVEPSWEEHRGVIERSLRAGETGT